MTPKHLSETVDWSFTPQPLWRQGVRWLPKAMVFVIEVLAPGGFIDGPVSRDPRVSPDRSVDLGGEVRVKGRGMGMPSRYPGWQPVTIYRDRATITPGLSATVLDLGALTVTSARRIGVPWTRRKAVDATWEVVTEGPEAELTFRGPWLFIAHLGKLGEWPEPA